MPDVISVTPDNLHEKLAGLPRLARLALGFAARIKRGTLDITLPDGRILRMGGLEPGPAAAMTVYNYGFATRLVNGGDIGIEVGRQGDNLEPQHRRQQRLQPPRAQGGGGRLAVGIRARNQDGHRNSRQSLSIPT